MSAAICQCSFSLWKHWCFLNDFQFACWLLNVISFPIKLVGKSLKMRPNIASDRAFFGPQNAYSLVIVSKLNFKANFVSNGHPNGTPNGVQNCPANGLWELQCDLWTSGRSKQGFWNQFGPTLTSLGANFWFILNEFATVNTPRIDSLCKCIMYMLPGRYKHCANTHGTVAENARTRTGIPPINL